VFFEFCRLICYRASVGVVVRFWLVVRYYCECVSAPCSVAVRIDDLLDGRRNTILVSVVAFGVNRCSAARGCSVADEIERWEQFV